MTLGEIYKLLDFITSKDNSGNTFSPIEFNETIKYVVQLIYNEEVEHFAESGTISDIVSPYVVEMGGMNAPMVVDVNGLSLIPKDYQGKISMFYKDGFNNRPVIMLNDKSIFDNLIGSTLKKPTHKHPACIFMSGYIKSEPKDLQYVDFTYFKKVETPFYDYYIDSNGDQIYLLQGISYLLKPGEEGSKGQTAATTVVSLSYELLMPDFIHVKIISKLLSIIGINLSNADILNYSELLQRKENSPTKG
jgi:hypothetical protein